MFGVVGSKKDFLYCVEATDRHEKVRDCFKIKIYEAPKTNQSEFRIEVKADEPFEFEANFVDFDKDYL